MSKINNRKSANVKAILRDFLMIGVGVVIAIILSKFGFIDYLINLFSDYYVVVAFLAGLFFTSIFTIAPASVTLIHIAQNSPISGVIIWGGIGAMCGDLILFLFIKDHFADDLKKVFKPNQVKYFLKSFHFGFMRWLSPIVGALIIASPLPDEFGITLLGMSKVKTIVLIPVSLMMNMLGIYLLIEFSYFL